MLSFIKLLFAKRRSRIRIRKVKEPKAMKTYRIEILRRKSQFTEWEHHDTIELRAKNIENALKRIAKIENPYQIHGRIEEV